MLKWNYNQANILSCSSCWAKIDFWQKMLFAVCVKLFMSSIMSHLIFLHHIIYPWKPSQCISVISFYQHYQATEGSDSLHFTPQHSLCHYSSISLPLELVWHDICWGSMDAISPYNPSVILSSHGNRDSSAPHVYLSTLFLVWWSISDPQAILQSDTRCDGEDSKPSCAN